MHLLYAPYYSVTTHLCKSKKVSILPLGDVNLRPVPSRRGLLEDSLYHAVGVACLSYDWPRLRTYGVGTQECLVVSSARCEYVLVMYAMLSVQH
jgi:hypothetical protein